MRIARMCACTTPLGPFSLRATGAHTDDRRGQEAHQGVGAAAEEGAARDRPHAGERAAPAAAAALLRPLDEGVWAAVSSGGAARKHVVRQEACIQACTVSSAHIQHVYAINRHWYYT